MPDEESKIEVLIMAAGASRRLGEPKQFVTYKGVTLIKRIVREALNADVGEVTVITGFNHDDVEKEIQDLDVSIYYNSEWEEGLGASIRNGLKHILSIKPDTDAILMTMVDQPYVDAKHLKKLVNAYDPSRQMIIASAYQGTFGVPVLVDNYYFEQLKELKGDEGGKRIFANYIRKIVEIPFIAGAIDIDEKKDLKTLK